MDSNTGAMDSEASDEIEVYCITQEQYSANDMTCSEDTVIQQHGKPLPDDSSQKNEKTKTTATKLCPKCGKILTVDFCLCVYKIPFRCERCQATFLTLPEFHLHMKQNHARKQQQDIAVKPIIVVKEDVEIKHENIVQEMYNCELCDEAFQSEFGLLAHKLNHASHATEETRSFKCNQCGREFSSRARLSIHVSRTHITEKKYFCKVCNKGFSNSSSLRMHTRLHLGVKPHKCNICGKSYSQASNLAYHKSTHVGIKSYICHICGKAFLTAGILANHERRHTGVKPYVCDFCGRGFTDNYTLMHHKVVHSGICSYMCDVCGKVFAHRSSLTSHKRIHTGEKRYQCTFCKRAFTQLSTMLQHQITHTGEKSHRCICGKAFTQHSSLARHKRMHEESREFYPCHLCNKKFGYKCTLYKHQRRSHGIEKPPSIRST